MKTTITNLIVVSALSFSGTALAAGEMVGKVQPPAAKPAASAVPVAPTAKPAAAAPAQAPQPAVKPPAPAEAPKAKPPRSKNLDLRHCLDLKTDAEIAKCAGE